MSKICRARAIRERLTNYFTGKPCKRGHLAPRNTVHGSCLDCQAYIGRAKRAELRKVDYIPGLDDPMPEYVPLKISRGIFPPETYDLKN